MAHCGYEGTAVNETFDRPLTAFWSFLRGPRTSGEFAPELPVVYGDRDSAAAVRIPVDQIGVRDRAH
jgi:hypothetical protein